MWEIACVAQGMACVGIRAMPFYFFWGFVNDPEQVLDVTYLLFQGYLLTGIWNSPWIQILYDKQKRAGHYNAFFGN